MSNQEYEKQMLNLVTDICLSLRRLANYREIEASHYIGFHMPMKIETVQSQDQKQTKEVKK